MQSFTRYISYLWFYVLMYLVTHYSKNVGPYTILKLKVCILSCRLLLSAEGDGLHYKSG